jgi:hypothetical protein
MTDRMSRQELIAIAERLLAADPARRQGLGRLIDEFEANVPWPEAADLVFENKGWFKSAAECVDFLWAGKSKKIVTRRTRRGHQEADECRYSK